MGVNPETCRAHYSHMLDESFNLNKLEKLRGSTLIIINTNTRIKMSVVL
jgi:hypothetical protein